MGGVTPDVVVGDELWAVLCHGSACTTAAHRSSPTSGSEESVRALARRCGISPTTVGTWRKRETVADQPMGPVEPHSTTLTLGQEAMILAFRRHTLLPLDDCLYALASMRSRPRSRP